MKKSWLFLTHQAASSPTLVTPSTWKSQHLCFLLAVRPPPPPPPPGMKPLEAELTTAVLMACWGMENGRINARRRRARSDVTNRPGKRRLERRACLGTSCPPAPPQTPHQPNSLSLTSVTGSLMTFVSGAGAARRKQGMCFYPGAGIMCCIPVGYRGVVAAHRRVVSQRQ